MSKEVILEDGTKETVYTQEDIAAKDNEISALKVLADEKTDNFKQFNEKLGKTDEELTRVKTQLADKEKAEKESAKTSTASRYHGNNEEIKANLDKNYAALAGMPETTPEEISARMEAAARLSGISVESRNPLYTPAYGEAPQQKAPGAKEDEFLKSEKGIAAQKAMGFTDAEITPAKQ